MIIFIYGEDSFRSARKVKELKNKFLSEVDKSGNSLSMLDGSDADMRKINEKVSTSSLLAKKRMIIIENIFSNKNILEEALEYFKNKEESDNIIIFRENILKTKRKGQKIDILKVDSSGREKPLTKKESQFYKFLSSQKFVQEFKTLSNLELSSWIKKEVEEKGGKISLRAVQTMIGLIGDDLWQIDREINKLINYKSGQNPKLTEGGEPDHIDVADVEEMVRGNFDENIFALTDAISIRNRAQATKLLEEQYSAGLTDSYLINMIIRQIKILLQIRQALDQGHSSRKIISELHLHPFIVQKGINQVRNFNLETLKRILEKLIEVDYQMKTGRAEAKLLLNLLIGKI